MKNPNKSLIALLILLFSLAGFAQKGSVYEGIENEDLQFIHEWTQNQRAAEVSELLQLSTAQVGNLRAIRAQLELIKTQFEAPLAEAQAALAATAAQVRSDIETTDNFSEENQAALSEKHHALREIRKELRKAQGETTSGILDVLTEDQVNAAKEYLRAQLAERKSERERRREANQRGEADEREEGVQREGRDRNDSRRTRRHLAKRALHFLISESFLNQFE